MVSVYEERLSDLWDEMQDLLEAHYREISRYPDIALAPDQSRYAALEKAGRLRTYTARDEGRLVGYAVFIVTTGLHYRHSLQAKQDVIYLDPSLRGAGAGLKLLRCADEALAAEGVQVVYQHAKLAHPALGRLLEHMGYEPVETVYTRRLDR